MALNKQQRAVLEHLRDEDRLLSTHEVGEFMRRTFRDSMHGYYDRAHALLVRMGDRGLVQRVKSGAAASEWRILPAGKQALDA